VTRNIVHASAIACTLLLAGVDRASAGIITLDANNRLEVRIHFTAPVQPAAHNAVDIGPITYSTTGSFIEYAAVYENGALLGSGTAANIMSARFADASSRLAGTAHDIIDFSAIADGVTDGLVTLSIIGGTGNATFNTDNLTMFTYGDSGGFLAYAPVITGVDVVRNIPEPTSLALFGLGLLGLAALRRRATA
jgi:hypothetical protein